MHSFADMRLPESVMHTLTHMQFLQPTPIQAQAIPLALSGRDILGSAQTGTGKTGAFGIPLVAHLINNPQSFALVMTPTRELASQVAKQLQDLLGKRSAIKSALLIGGEPMPKQLRQLRQRPRLLVGTPGRINDHLSRGSVRVSRTDFLVLDETDRMLDMGFSVQIERIIQSIEVTRQTLLFSATLPKNIERMAARFMHNPERIAIEPESITATNIDQQSVRLRDAEKLPALYDALNERLGSIIVFIKTKHGADKMAKQLAKKGHQADAIHGNLRQSKRDRVLKAFRDKKIRVLVATDVAARGLDVPHIEHVINYDLPQCAEDYIHRIGRTARAGAHGEALNFITPSDHKRWYDIECLLDPEKAKKRRPTNNNSPKKPKRRPGQQRGDNPQAKSRGSAHHAHANQKSRRRSSHVQNPNQTKSNRRSNAQVA